MQSILRWLLRGPTLKRIYQPESFSARTGEYGGVRFSRVEVVTDDGLTIAGLRSVSGAAPAIGTLLYFHGNGGCAANRADLVAPFASSGWDVIVADYRGYGDNTGAPNEAGLIADGLAFLRYAKNTQDGPLIVFGHSLGGAVAVSIATSRPEGIVGLLTLGMFASLALRSPPWVRPYLPESYDSLSLAKQVSVPWIIAHERGDEVTSVIHADALYEASRPGDSVRLERLQGGRHNLDAHKLMPFLDRLLQGG